MSNSTQHIIALVQAKIGHPEINPASNSAVGRVLGLSHTYVKRLISGDGVLSRDAFVRACKFLELPPEQIADLALQLSADGSEDEGMGAWMRNIAKGLRGSVVKSGASILLGAAAMVAHVDDARASVNLGFPAHHPAPAELPTLYIMVSRAWRAIRARILALHQQVADALTPRALAPAA